MIATVPLVSVEGLPIPIPALIEVAGISIYEISRTETHAVARIEAENLQPAIDACIANNWDYEL